MHLSVPAKVNSLMARIGLVAGYGKLPVIFAREAKAQGEVVIAFALKGAASPDLDKYVDKIHWLEWGNLQKALLLLVTERIKKVVMLGKIKKDIVFKEDEKLDGKAKELMNSAQGKRDYSILKEVSNLLSKVGVEVMDSTTYLKALIPSKGTLTKRPPTKEEWDDIKYGVDLARKLAHYDVGQTIAVKDKTVIAVEAVEGTDQTIHRAGGLVNGGFIVIKVSRPDQDMRFDVPLVGMETLETLIKSNGKVLALEEGKTLLIDKEEMIALADKKEISIVII